MADGILKVGTITTSSGSGTITIGQSGETVDMANGTITLNSDMKSTPAFEAYLSANANINDDAIVKIASNTEVFDTDSCYDNSSNYRFTPTTAGKYFVYARATFDTSANDLQMCAIFLYKNGSSIGVARTNFDNQYGEGATPVINTVVDMNGSSDYLEAYAQGDSSSGGQIVLQGNTTIRLTNFGAYKLIGI